MWGGGGISKSVGEIIYCDLLIEWGTIKTDSHKKKGKIKVNYPASERNMADSLVGVLCVYLQSLCKPSITQLPRKPYTCRKLPNIIVFECRNTEMWSNDLLNGNHHNKLQED